MKSKLGLLLIICLAGCEAPMGPAGESIQGEKGDQGERGLAGLQGLAGENGEAGDLRYVARFNSEDEISTWRKSDDLGTWRIEEGRLILSGTGVGRVMSVQPTTYFTSDLDISVDTEWLGGEDRSSYGILFRFSEKGAYGFGIAATAESYIVKEWDEDFDTDPENLIDGTFSTVINKEGKNTLRVVTSGSFFEFYINGTMVNSVTDETLTEGLIRLYVGNIQEVAFDNLEVIEMNEQPLLKPLSQNRSGTTSSFPAISGDASPFIGSKQILSAENDFLVH